jgi:ABC-type multidrug transport system fused ATPase/permease subunit
VAKLRAAYKIRTNINVLFLFAGHPVLDTTQMWQLDHLGDQLVVFAAHEEAAMTRPTAHIATSSQARSPLRLLSPQLHNVSATIKSESKVETQTSSAYPRTVTATPQAYISGLARQPTSIPIKRENGNEAPNLNGMELSYLGSFQLISTQEVAPGQGCPVQGADPSVVPKTEPLDAPHFVKPDNETDHIPISEVHSSTVYAEPARAAQQARLQRIIDEGSPERLEAEVKKNQSLLDNLKLQLVRASEQKDAQYFLQQIGMHLNTTMVPSNRTLTETLRSEKVDAPTVIGVVGNTGSGKSSIINAMLEEERLVPTNWYSHKMFLNHTLTNLACEPALLL